MKTLANISSFESLMNSKPVQINNWSPWDWLKVSERERPTVPKKQQQYDFSSNEMWEAFNKERKRRMFVKKISALINPTANLVASAQNLQKLITSCTQSGGSMPYKNLKQFTDAWTKTYGVFAKAANTVRDTTKQLISQQQGAPTGAPTGNPAAPVSGSPAVTGVTNPMGDNGYFTVQDPNLAKPAAPPPPQPNYGTTTSIGAGEVNLPNGTVGQPGPQITMGGGDPTQQQQTIPNPNAKKPDVYAFNPQGSQGTPAGGFGNPAFSDRVFSVK